MNRVLFVVAVLATAAPQSAIAQSRLTSAPRLAALPPMGFNTWNKFGCNVSDRLIRETADAIVATGMKDAGYRYVVIDDCWQVSRDARGTITADAERFPRGVKDLADYVHSKGLSFGMYTDLGPKTCAGRPGSYGHEAQDARTYAGWGVDYIKVDWCHADSFDAKTRYTIFRDALRNSGRAIVLSICEWGQNDPWSWAPAVGQLWRTTSDISDNWESVVQIIGASGRHFAAAGPGHWNDPDMLEVGNGGMTTTEYQAHFSMWAMMAAPLIAGNDLRAMTAETAAILTNREVIAIDQDPLGVQGRVVIDVGDGVQVWVKPLQDRSRAVAFLNVRADTAEGSVRWKNLGIPPGAATVRDLWQHRDLGFHTDSGRDYGERLTVRIPPHGVVMLRVRSGGRARSPNDRGGR